MTIDKYYNNINKLVCDFCKKYKLQLLDIFLVGSRVSDNGTIKNKNADYDSVIIIKDNLELDDLKRIRDDLQNEINETDKLGLYHFKLFSLDEFEKAKHYDGFRIYEFHLDSKPYLGRMEINISPSFLNEFNFINSILIQEVHQILTNSNLSGHKDNGKVKKRFERNIKILQSQNTKPYCSNDFENFCKKDTLYHQFKKLGFNKSDWIYFIDNYFERFRHEFINKHKVYMKTINSFQKVML